MLTRIVSTNEGVDLCLSQLPEQAYSVKPFMSSFSLPHLPCLWASNSAGQACPSPAYKPSSSKAMRCPTNCSSFPATFHFALPNLLKVCLFIPFSAITLFILSSCCIPNCHNSLTIVYLT